MSEPLGTCRTPHFLGEPTPDRKALTQIPHHKLPQDLCKEWTPVEPVQTHDEDCPCYGDYVEHSEDCKNCTCEKVEAGAAGPGEREAFERFNEGETGSGFSIDKYSESHPSLA